MKESNKINMHSLIALITLALVFLIVGCGGTQSSFANDTVNSIVKKSSSGICHDESSVFYSRTKTFTPYGSISACIASGGRLPKSRLNNTVNEAIDANGNYVTLYDRSDWPHWADDDRDCQNTRHELLIATSKIAVSFKTMEQCIVLTGSWYDPYSGDTLTDSSMLDLDHTVPLKFAHGRGGRSME